MVEREVSFWAKKKVMKPVRVSFKAKGTRLTFIANKPSIKRVRVKFKANE